MKKNTWECFKAHFSHHKPQTKNITIVVNQMNFELFLHKMWVQLLIGTVTFNSLFSPLCSSRSFLRQEFSLSSCSVWYYSRGWRCEGKGKGLLYRSSLLCGVLVDHFASVHRWGSWAFPGALLLFNLMQWRLSVHANCNMQTYQEINTHYFRLQSLRVIRFMIETILYSFALYILDFYLENKKCMNVKCYSVWLQVWSVSLPARVFCLFFFCMCQSHTADWAL